MHTFYVYSSELILSALILIMSEIYIVLNKKFREFYLFI